MNKNLKIQNLVLTVFSVVALSFALQSSASAATQTATLTASDDGLDPALEISVTDVSGPGSGTEIFPVSLFGPQAPPFNITNNEVFSYGNNALLTATPNFRWNISHNICSRAKLQSMTMDSTSTVNDFNEVTDPLISVILTNTTNNTAYFVSNITEGYPVLALPTQVLRLPNPAEDRLPDSQQLSLNGNIIATWDLANTPASDNLALAGLYVTGNELDSYKINSMTITYDDSECTDQVVAVDDTTSTAPNKPVKFKVIDNDTDNSGGILSVSHINGLAVTIGQEVVLSDGSGTAVLSADGEITFIPSSNFTGVARIPYTITNSTGSTSSAVLSVTVSASPPNTGYHQNNSHTYLIVALALIASLLLLSAFSKVYLTIR